MSHLFTSSQDELAGSQDIQNEDEDQRANTLLAGKDILLADLHVRTHVNEACELAKVVCHLTRSTIQASFCCSQCCVLS